MRWFLALGALLLSACTSGVGNDGGDVDSADTTPSGALAAATSDVPATTSPPSSTTTLDPTGSGRATRAYLDSWERLNEALLDPADLAKIESALALLANPRRETIRERLLTNRANGTFEQTRPEMPASTSVVDGSLTITDGVATLLACEVDSNLVLRGADGGASTDEQPPDGDATDDEGTDGEATDGDASEDPAAAADAATDAATDEAGNGEAAVDGESGGDAVVVDAVTARLVEVSVTERDGAWLVAGVTQQRVFSDQGDCDS